MRLNRRKNRGSESGRRPASRGSRKSAQKGSLKEDGKPRQSLARSVRALRSRQGRKRVARAALSVAADVWGIAREILRWPARIWMAVAEALGTLILKAWRAVAVPAWRIGRRLLRAALAFGERAITPARGLAVVAIAATVALGGSQFGDYRAVEVGQPGYVKVQDVAQAPQVEPAMPRSAHGVSVFAIAVACLFVTLFAVWRNWRLARLLLFAGVAVVAISLFIDRPEGLRLGSAGEAYAGAHAVLLGSFWAQLFSGVTLIVVGPLLAVQLRGERAGRRGHAGVRSGDDDRKTKRAPRLRPGVGT